MEIAWLAALVVATFLGAGLKTRTWLMVDVVLTILFVFGTMPIIVDITKTETRGLTLDSHHGHLARQFLGWVSMPAIVWIFLRRSTSDICEVAMLSSRVVGAGLGSVFMAIQHFTHDCFTPMHLYYGVLGDAAWGLVSAIHLYKGGLLSKKGLFTRNPSKLDFFFKVDITLVCTYGIPDMLCPSFVFWLGQMKPDALHLHLLWVGSAMIWGTLTLCILGHFFKNDEEKRAVLIGRIISMTGMFGVRTYAYLYLGDTSSFFDYFFFVLSHLAIFPAYVGLRQTQTSFKSS